MPLPILTAPLSAVTQIALDVRPLLAAGHDPLTEILEAAERVPPGGCLVLTAPFDPLPLYEVLAGRGFTHETDDADPAAVVVRFQRAGFDGSTPVADVVARHPETATLLHAQGLDSCCGGAHPLETACAAHGVALDPLLAALRAAVANGGTV